MQRILIETQTPVTLVGAGPVSRRQIADSLLVAPELYAADGGAQKTVGLSRPLRAVIGDLDSLTRDETWRNSGTQIIEIDEQDTTDFEKCLSIIRAPLIVGLGFLDGRLDHQIAALGALVASPLPVILVGRTDLCLHVPSDIVLDLSPGTRLSLMPINPVTVTGSGLRWPLDHLTLAPGGRTGVSNVTVAPQVRVATGGPGCLLVLPRRHLAALARQVLAGALARPLSTPAH
jgi:thiamine pyrophosphokinase